MEHHLSAAIADELLSFARLIPYLILQNGNIYTSSGCDKDRILLCTGESPQDIQYNRNARRDTPQPRLR